MNKLTIHSHSNSSPLILVFLKPDDSEGLKVLKMLSQNFVHDAIFYCVPTRFISSSQYL
jgi:hypothetical protein